MEGIREAKEADLESLLELYTYLGENPFPVDPESFRPVWEKLLQNPICHVFLAERDGRAVSSCTLLVVPNLTHGGRPYALVENVVTRPEYRRQGLGSAVLNAARDLAVREGCYKIMLLTVSKRQSTLDFYRRAGYRDDLKTGFCQTFPEK